MVPDPSTCARWSAIRTATCLAFMLHHVCVICFTLYGYMYLQMEEPASRPVQKAKRRTALAVEKKCAYFAPPVVMSFLICTYSGRRERKPPALHSPANKTAPFSADAVEVYEV